MRVRIVLFICVAALATGCEKSTETAEKSANDPAASSANHEDDVANPRELLLRMAAAYAEADSYFDRGMLRLSRTLAGETTIDDVPFSVKFERPNRVRIEAYQVVIASDGNRLVAKIFDEATNEMDHQALVRPAPKQIDAETLYLDPQQADPILAEILVGGIVGLPPTLEMLLAKEAPDLTQEAEQYVLGVDDEIDGRRCRRLVYQTPNGALTMFVDADNYLLRRVEYPQKAMLAALQANDPNARISLVADFVDAAVDDPIHESEFLFNIPATDKKVTYFVRPPQRSTSDQLGSQPPTFAFESLTGEEESSADFVGAPTILAWINDHPSSRLMTEQLTRFAADASTGVQIKLVSVDPSDTTSELVAQRLEQWGANFAAYRDVHAVGRQQFRIPGAPTLLLLDAEGKVQFMEAGAAPDLAERLWTVARRLAQGEDVAAATLAAVKAEQKLYQAALTASMAGKNPYRDLPLPSAKIAPASELSQFDSQLVWTSGDIEKPGAVAVLHDSEERRIFVLDDGQAVCELSPEGKLISRHALELGDAIKVDRIRVAASDQGVRVAVFSADGQH
ncbi:MAG: TlpA family protein disulfide reductase, partial [Blastopirellula sp. JB062]